MSVGCINEMIRFLATIKGTRGLILVFKGREAWQRSMNVWFGEEAAYLKFVSMYEQCDARESHTVRRDVGIVYHGARLGGAA
jgi:hypothetical protein